MNTEEPTPTLETAADAFPEEGSTPLRIVAGDKIGPFKVLQLLGEGGFGAVYQCDQEEPVKRRVAVKIIKAGDGHRRGRRPLPSRAPSARDDGSPIHREGL